MKFRRYSSFCDTLPEWGNVSKQFLKFLDNLKVLSKDQILTKLLIERGYAELIKGYFYNKRGKLIPNQEDIITTVTIRELTMCIWNKLYKDRYIPYHEIIEFRLFSKNDIIPIKEIKQEARKLVKEQKYYKTLLSRVAKEKPYKLNHHGAKQNIRNIENNEHAIQFIKENAKYTPARDLYIKWLDISINNQGYYDMISRRNGGSVVHTFWKNLCKNSYISWKPFKEQIWFNGTAFDITDINNISLINTPNYNDINMDWISMSTYNGKIITKGGQDNVVGYDQINNNPIFKMIIENLIKNGYNVNIVNGTKIFDIVYIRNDVAFGRRYTNMKDILNIAFAYSYIKDTNYYADFFSIKDK